MPSTPGSARRSSSSNSLLMFTVERTSVEGSTQAALVPLDIATRMRMQNRHRRIAPLPGRDRPSGAGQTIRLLWSARLSRWCGRHCDQYAAGAWKHAEPQRGWAESLAGYTWRHDLALSSVEGRMGAGNAVLRRGSARVVAAEPRLGKPAAGPERPAPAKRRVATRSSCTMPGSVMAWPASATMRRSACGQARQRSQAFLTGVTTS